jgi:hypothetical protein
MAVSPTEVRRIAEQDLTRVQIVSRSNGPGIIIPYASAPVVGSFVISSSTIPVRLSTITSEFGFVTVKNRASNTTNLLVGNAQQQNFELIPNFAIDFHDISPYTVFVILESGSTSITVDWSASGRVMTGP